MQGRPKAKGWVAGFALALWAVAAGSARGDAGRGWTPEAWADEGTIEIRTQKEGEEPHWFKVWLVVIDGKLYVRLGKRAAARVRSNRTGDIVAVRIAGRAFERVRIVPVPDMAYRVDEAMAEKYWSDVLVRHIAHPLVARLEPVRGEAH